MALCYSVSIVWVWRNNKIMNCDKVERKIDEIRQHLDIHLHSLISPYKWIMYSDLVDLIDELRELINDN